MRDDDAVDAGAFGRAQQHAEVLRVLERIDDQDERGIRERVEVEQKLVELDAGLALDDRDDALVVLDRREPRDLELVHVADEDAAGLRLGDELVHRTGARRAILRHVEPADAATGAHRFEDRVGSGDRLAGFVRGRRRARARGDAADRLLVPLLAGARSAPAGAGGPAGPAAGTPGLSPDRTARAALVRRELARLLAVFARGRRAAELLAALIRRTALTGERRAPRSLVRRARAGVATAPAAATAPPAPPAAEAVVATRGLLRRLRLRVLARGLRGGRAPLDSIGLFHAHAPLATR